METTYLFQPVSSGTLVILKSQSGKSQAHERGDIAIAYTSDVQYAEQICRALNLLEGLNKLIDR